MKIIELQADRKAEKKVINGVEFLVSVSPYFFPERLECAYDPTEGTYAIAFRYLDNEPAADSPAASDDLLDVNVGRHTGRVLSVVVHVDRNDIDRIGMMVTDHAPKALGSIRPSRPELIENYRMATDVLRRHRLEFAACDSG
jgi:hypothetical protein